MIIFCSSDQNSASFLEDIGARNFVVLQSSATRFTKFQDLIISAIGHNFPLLSLLISIDKNEQICSENIYRET